MKYILILDEYLIGKFQVVLNFLQRIHYLSQVGYYRIFMFISFCCVGIIYIIGQTSSVIVALQALMLLFMFSIFLQIDLEKRLDSDNTANNFRYSEPIKIFRLTYLFLNIFYYQFKVYYNEFHVLTLFYDATFLTAQYFLACDNLPKDKRKSFWENFNFANPKTVTEN